MAPLPGPRTVQSTCHCMGPSRQIMHTRLHEHSDLYALSYVWSLIYASLKYILNLATAYAVCVSLKVPTSFPKAFVPRHDRHGINIFSLGFLPRVLKAVGMNQSTGHTEHHSCFLQRCMEILGSCRDDLLCLPLCCNCSVDSSFVQMTFVLTCSLSLSLYSWCFARGTS